MIDGSPLRWRQYGGNGALIELGSLDEVHRLHHAIRTAGLIGAQIIEAVPGAETLLLVGPGSDPAALVRLVEQLPRPSTTSAFVGTHTILVRYDGPDLGEVATLTGLSVDEVVRRHTGPLYTVAFLGFSRSFPYFAGLDPSLHVPRRSTPRTSVPKGSVGMGAAFTGVYPASSPGGWQLLGRTNLEFFDPGRDPPSVLSVGDRVRFLAVDTDMDAGG